MSLRACLQHRLHPLHVYCRLRDLGLGKRQALGLARAWERLLGRLKRLRRPLSFHL